MSTSLTNAQITQYKRDGFLFPLPALPPDEAQRYCDTVNDLERRLGPDTRPTDMNQLHLHFGWAYDLVMNTTVLDAVEGVLGPNIVVWGAGVFAKKPHDPGFVSWHQDGAYWGLDSIEVATAWIALSNSTVENGCMRVVGGTHLMPYRPHDDTYKQENLLSRGQEVQVDVDEDDATDLVLAAGQMSLHDVRIIHGSNANRSDTKRVGVAIRYITPQVSQPGRRPRAVLARGSDDGGHYELVGRPAETSMAEAIEALRETAREHMAAVMPKK